MPRLRQQYLEVEVELEVAANKLLSSKIFFTTFGCVGLASRSAMIAYTILK